MGAWFDRCEWFFRLRHRRIATLVDYGPVGLHQRFEAWRWDEPRDRPGSANEVATALVQELDAANPRSRLMQGPNPDPPLKGERVTN